MDGKLGFPFYFIFLFCFYFFYEWGRSGIGTRRRPTDWPNPIAVLGWTLAPRNNWSGPAKYLRRYRRRNPAVRGATPWARHRLSQSAILSISHQPSPSDASPPKKVYRRTCGRTLEVPSPKWTTGFMRHPAQAPAPAPLYNFSTSTLCLDDRTDPIPPAQCPLHRRNDRDYSDTRERQAAPRAHRASRHSNSRATRYRKTATRYETRN